MVRKVSLVARTGVVYGLLCSARASRATHQIGETTFKVHLDGFDLTAFLSGKEQESPRQGFVYWTTTAT